MTAPKPTPKRAALRASHRQHAYGTTVGYSPTILPTERPPVLRPGAADHEQHPSRMGNTLVYRDGRRVPVEG